MITISPIRIHRYNQTRREHLGEVGELVGYTVVRSTPTGMELVDQYIIGLVKLKTQIIIAQIVDMTEGEIKIGIKLIGRLRRLMNVDDKAIIPYGIKFGSIR